MQLTHYDGGLPELPQVSQLGQFHVGRVHASGALPDGRHIATAGEDGSIRLWNVHTHRCTARRTFSSAQL
ncbi:TPA: Ribosome biogenesis protein erb1 [Trebouxia sp. C0006]